MSWRWSLTPSRAVPVVVVSRVNQCAPVRAPRRSTSISAGRCRHAYAASGWVRGRNPAAGSGCPGEPFAPDAGCRQVRACAWWVVASGSYQPGVPLEDSQSPVGSLVQTSAGQPVGRDGHRVLRQGYLEVCRGLAWSCLMRRQGDVRHVGVAMRQDVGVTASPPVAAAARPAPGAVLDAVLERITYANEETGYTIARVATDRTGTDLLTVVGSLLGVQPGESLRLVGRWGSHPKYGRQFEAHSFTTVLPATIQGIERYLGSGLIKGIGPKMAARIVAHFGADTLRVIEEQPARLVEVAGLGPKRTAMIGTAWEEQKAIKEVMVFLQGVGVSTSLAVRIYKKYADASISVVRNEPYRLAADVWGIGFKTADTIAQAVGIPHDSPARVQARLPYTLSQVPDDGHSSLPQPQLVTDAAKILGVPTDLIGACLDELVTAEGVVREALPGQDGPVPAVYLVPFHRAEAALAGSLLRLLKDRKSVVQGKSVDLCG